jgi:RNA polymerase sigma-70 factor (ECF subfamily)
MDHSTEQWVAERWAAGRAAWPGVELERGVFAAFVKARIDEPEDLSSVRPDELYLTCACTRGDARAHAHLETRYFGQVVASLARLRLGTLRIDEIKQTLRARLLVSDGGRRPRIAAYSGRGDLGSWLRVTAVRAALRQLRTEKRAERAHAELRQMPIADADAELAMLKRQYGSQVRAALASSLEGLGTREKNLLWQYYLDGLTIQQIGALYGTHRVTVARWLDAIRQRLLDDTRHVLVSSLRTSQGECESIIRMVQSQLELTLHRLLGDH